MYESEMKDSGLRMHESESEMKDEIPADFAG